MWRSWLPVNVAFLLWLLAGPAMASVGQQQAERPHSYVGKDGESYTVSSAEEICDRLKQPIFREVPAFNLLASAYPNPRDVRRLIQWDVAGTAQSWAERHDFKPDFGCFEGALCRRSSDEEAQARKDAAAGGVRNFLICVTSLRKADPTLYSNLTSFFLPIDPSCTSEASCVRSLVSSGSDCMGCAPYARRPRLLFTMLIVREAGDVLQAALDVSLGQIRSTIRQLQSRK